MRRSSSRNSLRSAPMFLICGKLLSIILANSFLDFLSLYGHFSGEELEEIDEEDEDDYDDLESHLPTDDDGSNTVQQQSAVSISTIHAPNQIDRSILPSHLQPSTERTPLLRGRSELKPKLGRKRSQSVGRHGDATVPQAVLMVRVMIADSQYTHLVAAAAQVIRGHRCAVSRQGVSGLHHTVIYKTEAYV